MFVAVGTMLSGCVSTGPTQSTVSAGEAEKITEVLRKLSDSWGQSAVTKDTAFLKSIWADDFSYIGADGTVRDEEANLALYASSTDTYTSAGLTAFNVRVYGKNFAVTNGDDRYVGKDKDGKPFEKKGRFTNVWIREKRKMASCGGARDLAQITSRHTWVALPAPLIKS